MPAPRSGETPPRDVKARDPRLDFFRGVAMAIILIAHIPGNPWILWIPARFGFSDATEIFVFCSGLASALAFGATFASAGWVLGTVRILHRVWQVYWAHIGVFAVTVAMLAAFDLGGGGAGGKVYLTEPYVLPFFEHGAAGLLGLMTLSYTPGLFDILPMYLVILAMAPLVMALHGAAGGAAVAAALALLWLGANLAAFAAQAPDAGGLGDRLQFLLLPAAPWDPAATWFFNPFGWQILFFAGFAFGMGWLPAPPVTAPLVAAAAAVVVLCLPIAWFRLHQPGFFLPDALTGPLTALRDWLHPLWWKQHQGGLRLLHFFAVAYLAWAAVGPRGLRLSAPLPLAAPAPARRARVLAWALACALLSAPYAWIDGLGDGRPLLPFLPAAPYAVIGWASVVQAAALTTLAWNLAPGPVRGWLLGKFWLQAVTVLRRVGSQSLAVFMTSIPLSQLIGFLLDHFGRTPVNFFVANAGGVALLVATAYLAAWIKSQPWRQAVSARRAPTGAPSIPAERVL